MERGGELQQKLALRGMLSCCASAKSRAHESQDTATATGVADEAGGSDQAGAGGRRKRDGARDGLASRPAG